MSDSLFSWTTLMTLSGAAIITFLIVLYIGRVIDGCKWWKWGTDLYAAFWAFLNSFLVAASAGKLMDKSSGEDQRRTVKIGR